ncbi:MAG: hypothetical protein J4432_03010 [DPANN group archaeon]|nr:hypothetical protein [DPANN group archaeon]
MVEYTEERKKEFDRLWRKYKKELEEEELARIAGAEAAERQWKALKEAEERARIAGESLSRRSRWGREDKTKRIEERIRAEEEWRARQQRMGQPENKAALERAQQKRREQELAINKQRIIKQFEKLRRLRGPLDKIELERLVEELGRLPEGMAVDLMVDKGVLLKGDIELLDILRRKERAPSKKPESKPKPKPKPKKPRTSRDFFLETRDDVAKRMDKLRKQVKKAKALAP